MIDRSRRCRPVRTGRVLAAVLALAGVSACSGGDDTPPSTTSSTTTIAVVLGLPVVALTESYFGALAQLPATDPGAPLSAVPGSEAAIFAQHQSAARRLLGLMSPRSSVEADDGFTICETDGETDGACSTYTGVVTEPASGRLTSFSVDGVPLTGRIVGAGPAVDRDGVVVRVGSAYLSVTGDQSVVLVVDNSSEVAVELFGFAAVLQPTGDSEGATGASVEAAGAWGDATVEPATSGELMLTFPSSVVGGQLRLSGLRSDGLDVSLEITVPTP